jgi:hypothetical protein
MMDRTPEHLLDQLVSIHRPQTSIDASGAAVTLWPAWRVNVPARIEPMRGSRDMHHGRVSTLLRWRIYMKGDIPLRPGDRLSWQGYTMDVQSVINVHAQSRLLVIETQEIK